MSELTVDIITAEKSLVEGAVADSLIAPGAAGEFEVLAGHTTLLSGLEPGRVTITGPQGTLNFVISGGFAEVMLGHVRILADKAMAVADIKAEDVKQALVDLEAKQAEVDPFSDEADSLRQTQRYLETQQALSA
jgi:F-type H+-transporting ATPase subunit epsilon